MRINSFITISIILLSTNILSAQLVRTLAGVLGTPGYNDGPALSARFSNPHSIASDGAGNIYVADRYNHTIRKISADGIVSTVAGKAKEIGDTDGQGIQARFNEPWGICATVEGELFVADTKNNKIRKIDKNGLVTTIAGNGTFGNTDGPALAASFGNPTGIVSDGFGYLYITDHLTHVIRKINATGIVSTIAGTPSIPGKEDGIGSTAQFWRPYGLTIDNNGHLLIADEWNHKIRKLNINNGQVSTIAGTGEIGLLNGNTHDTRFNYPWDIAVDDQNNIYVADGYNYVIRKISTDGKVSTYAGIPLKSGGADGPLNKATFSGITSIVWNTAFKRLYISDAYNHLIRILDENTTPTIDLINMSGQDQLCMGESLEVKVNLSSFNSYFYYVDGVLWSTSDQAEYTFSGLQPGFHILEVETFWGNTPILSNAIAIEIFEASTLDFEASKINIQPNEIVDFQIIGDQPQQVIWDFGVPNTTGSYARAYSPSYQYQNSGAYDVQLITLNEYGCWDTLFKPTYIHVIAEIDLFIPTGFTPNKDGENDIFLVRGPSLDNYQMVIYDQWGGVLFSSNQQTQGWDGMKNNQSIDCGTYTYILKWDSREGSQYRAGHITLLR